MGELMTESTCPFAFLGFFTVSKEESSDLAEGVIFPIVSIPPLSPFLCTLVYGEVGVGPIVPAHDIPAVSDLRQVYRMVGMMSGPEPEAYAADLLRVPRERPAWVTPYPRGAKLTSHAVRRGFDPGVKKNKKRR